MSEYWTELRNSLNSTQRARYEALVARLKALGARNPDEWALSEIAEDTPQLARYCLLRRVWPELIDVYKAPQPWISNTVAASERDPRAPFSDAGLALKRLLGNGAQPEDISIVARAVAYEAVFGCLELIDKRRSPHAEDACPGWRLVEVGRDGKLTGRELGGLHESLLSMDPSGREGRPGP